MLLTTRTYSFHLTASAYPITNLFILLLSLGSGNLFSISVSIILAAMFAGMLIIDKGVVLFIHTISCVPKGISDFCNF